MGHTDMITIGDAGLPIPNSTKRIDIAVEKGMPSFLGVLEVLLEEMEIEEVIIAKELEKISNTMYGTLIKLLKEKCKKAILTKVPHKEFKEIIKESKGIIRTGECTFYANIILKSGVVFTEKG